MIVKLPVSDTNWISTPYLHVALFEQFVWAVSMPTVTFKYLGYFGKKQTFSFIQSLLRAFCMKSQGELNYIINISYKAFHWVLIVFHGWLIFSKIHTTWSCTSLLKRINLIIEYMIPTLFVYYFTVRSYQIKAFKRHISMIFGCKQRAAMIAFLLEVTSLIMHDVTFAEFRSRLETFGTAFDAENYNLLSCSNQYLKLWISNWRPYQIYSRSIPI